MLSLPLRPAVGAHLLMQIVLRQLGGKGSGNFGHGGRPGEVGGSTSVDDDWFIKKSPYVPGPKNAKGYSAIFVGYLEGFGDDEAPTALFNIIGGPSDGSSVMKETLEREGIPLPPYPLKVKGLGGKGSGNFGHAGRPGERGGSSPSGSEGTWTPEKGGLLFHGTEKSPKETAVYGNISDQPMFLTPHYGEAEGYAQQVHRFGVRSTGTEHVLELHAKPGKTVDANQVVEEALEEGDDPEVAAIEAGRKAGADYVTYQHPSNIPGREEQQDVVIALHPRKSLSYNAAWNLKQRSLELVGLGGKGSGNYGHSGRPGERGGSDTGSGPTEKVRNARSLRALKAFIPIHAESQRYAEANELSVRKMVGGQRTEGNAPVDVEVVIDGRKKGIEVKTMVNNTNDKITMRKAAIEKKDTWGRRNHASVHTVVLDDRGKLGHKSYSGHRLYYRRGSGSFRLAGMIKVTSPQHLKELLSK